jgi:hypothetical protein
MYKDKEKWAEYMKKYRAKSITAKQDKSITEDSKSITQEPEEEFGELDYEEKISFEEWLKAEGIEEKDRKKGAFDCDYVCWQTDMNAIDNRNNE